jgi:hypothetical protein
MITLRADTLRRLNVILGLGSPIVDIPSPGTDAWNILLDDLFFAVFGQKKRIPAEDVFHQSATREGVRAAQEGLRGQLPALQRAKQQRGPLLHESVPSFELSKQTLYLLVDQEGFFGRYVTLDFPTLVYNTLNYLLGRTGIKPSDLLTCANEKCRKLFVPLRKPHKGKKSFCKQKCGNLISAREYRKKRAKQLRKKERLRNQNRYDKKIHEKFPGATIHRRKRRKKKRKN